MVLINPEVTDEALTAAVDEVSGYITTPGAEITYIKRDTPWGRRRLAYPIQRFRDATYVLIQFLASPSHLPDIERELKLDERVIRYLLVRQEHLHMPEEDETEGEAEAAPESEEVAQSESEEHETEETESALDENQADEEAESDEDDGSGIDDEADSEEKEDEPE